MAATARKPKLLAIVGPTASGKSKLAMRIAKEFNGEIIAADSRTIYKGMDIGTAKPGEKEQTEIPHWGLGLIEPGVSFSAHKFKKYAEGKIKDIQKRGKLPLLVGGTGLYVDSVLFDFEFVPSDTSKRNELENLSLEQLQQIIKDRGYKLPENSKNRRHLIRIIERQGKTGNKSTLREGALIIGITPPTELLKDRINKRTAGYFKLGFIKEIKALLNKYSQEEVSKTGGIAYSAGLRLIKKEITHNEAIKLIQKEEWQYARRQRTWFRRNKFIQWYDNTEEAYKSIAKILNN